MPRPPTAITVRCMALVCSTQYATPTSGLFNSTQCTCPLATHPSTYLTFFARYALYMAEPDGTIDTDFPSLDLKEPIGKFGFELLGLVDVAKDECGDAASDGERKKRRVTVVLPNGTFTVMFF